jgi:hypothetical protein
MPLYFLAGEFLLFIFSIAFKNYLVNQQLKMEMHSYYQIDCVKIKIDKKKKNDNNLDFEK